ncbi:Spo0B domain-containing protein [Ureibacillus chungkukjangi]|uniref:Stage 0 sporulation protein B (Sporulation initiation phosphotransferase) n=1 Tax=Ureibacillus chungkukjangi TaxID=1202712 RepID=A0A318TVG1_9BACL|nr:Spo0B domain-containing protein [Ureibacillus chungkukjangi]MCM3388071.1 sporulation initiation phosphotransferase B [Ureibacillus chungkukjangi]PYF08861.1 stage 0 sporulation protein B (sporulation initiation phosphotransferase) [Ureibacillus chungkukjangi]
MKTSTLSVNDVLRFANHDYMNQIQLLKMNLDLGRIEEAKSLIEKFSEQSKTLSNINKLKLPKTGEWLQTIQWRFQAFETTINSNISFPIDMKNDEQIVEYLEKTVIHVYDTLDPFSEQQLEISIESNENEFTLLFDLKGKWEAQIFDHEENNNLKVQTYEQTTNEWKYALSIEQE